jgi:hypothetical protein
MFPSVATPEATDFGERLSRCSAEVMGATAAAQGSCLTEPTACAYGGGACESICAVTSFYVILRHSTHSCRATSSRVLPDDDELDDDWIKYRMVRSHRCPIARTPRSSCRVHLLNNPPTGQAPPPPYNCNARASPGHVHLLLVRPQLSAGAHQLVPIWWWRLAQRSTCLRVGRQSSVVVRCCSAHNWWLGLASEPSNYAACCDDQGKVKSKGSECRRDDPVGTAPFGRANTQARIGANNTCFLGGVPSGGRSGLVLVVF